MCIILYSVLTINIKYIFKKEGISKIYLLSENIPKTVKTISNLPTH